MADPRFSLSTEKTKVSSIAYITAMFCVEMLLKGGITVFVV